MKNLYPLIIFLSLLSSTTCFSQNIYFKNVNDSILPQFKDTSNKIIIVNGDSALNLKNLIHKLNGRVAQKIKNLKESIQFKC